MLVCKKWMLFKIVVGAWCILSTLNKAGTIFTTQLSINYSISTKVYQIWYLLVPPTLICRVMILMYYVDGTVPLSVCVREMNVRSHKYISIIILIYLFDTITILSFNIIIYSYQYNTTNKYSVFDTYLYLYIACLLLI